MKITYSVLFVCISTLTPAYGELDHTFGHETRGGARPAGQAAPNPAKDFAFPCPIGPKDKTPALKLLMFQPGLKEDDAAKADMMKQAAAGATHAAVADFRGRSAAEILKQLPGVDLLKARLSVHEDGFIPGMAAVAANYTTASRVAKDFAAMHKLLPGKDSRENQELLSRLSQMRGSFEEIKANVLGGIVDNNYQLEAWRSVPRPRPDAGEEALAVEIDKIAGLRDRPRDDLRSAATALQRKPVWGDGSSWMELEKAVATAYLSMAENKYKARKRLPDMATLRATIADPTDRFKEAGFSDDIIDGFGVKSTSENIGRLYCEALKEGKGLNVVVDPIYFNTVLMQLTAAGGGNLNLKFRQGGHDFEMRNGIPEDVTPFPEPPVVDPSRKIG